MERGQRLALIKKLGRHLEGESFTDTKLTLKIYELPDPDWHSSDEYQDQYAYVIDQLTSGTDAQLAEMHRGLFPDDPEVFTPAEPAVGQWSAGAFKLFVSHTNAFRSSAGRLRKQLADWGVDAFVAHDAIEPTREWQDEIKAALATCDAMCVMVTPELVESHWCDQEVGFALARGILIAPIKLGVDPHGFLARLQAVSTPDRTTAYDVADKLFDVLARNPLTLSAMVPAIVRRFVNSGSHENTRAAFVLLETIPKSAWTEAMVDQVSRAWTLNTQVGDAALPGGRKTPDAVAELIESVRPHTSSLADDDFVSASVAGDEDIPF